jgi:hypothetical protein
MNTFGAAWLTLAIVFGIHVLDEAATDFLAWYNPTAQRIRSHLWGAPFPPVFTFWPWLLGLLAITAILLVLAPMAYSHVAWLVPVAIAFSLINIGNALLHISATIFLRRRVPGLISAPFLLASAGWLLYAAVCLTSSCGKTAPAHSLRDRIVSARSTRYCRVPDACANPHVLAVENGYEVTTFLGSAPQHAHVPTEKLAQYLDALPARVWPRGPTIDISPTDVTTDLHAVAQNLSAAKQVCRSLGLVVQVWPGG